MKYGERLRKARKHKGLSQALLATAAGTSQANISALEKGDATGSEFTAQFAIACEVNPLWLAAERGDFEIGIYVQDLVLKQAIKAIEPLKPYQQEIAKQEILEVVNKIVETSEIFNKE